jgi:hypothetical protein
MPSIKYAHVCEYARIDVNGTVSIIGIFDTINAPALPVNFPFLHVITSLTGHKGETFQFQTRLSAPDGKILQAAPAVAIAFHQLESSTNQINGYLGVVFPAYGVYSIEFVIDGISVHTIPFRVTQNPHR